MAIYDFLISNFGDVDNPFILAIILGIIFTLIYDFYHLLFSSVLTWFKK